MFRTIQGTWRPFTRFGTATAAWPASSSRAGYAAAADIALVTATQDLRRMLDAGLVSQRGAGRSVRYLATDALRAAVAG